MDEYISRNELLKDVQSNVAEAHNERCAQLLEAILNAPTADVVPKSEVVDKLHEVIFKKEDLMQKIAEERNKYFDELETVKDNNEHLAVMLEEAKASKDALIKNYAECMKDYAREIFAEIEKEIDRGLSVIEKILNTKGGRANGKTVLISKYDVYREAKKYIAELKKKYTEGEQ